MDLVVILNFLVDFLLLMGTNRLSGFPLSCARAAAASLLGALYAAVCLLPGFRFLGSVLWRFVSLALMATIAFGWNRSAWKRTGVFVLLSTALGGMALQFESGNILTLILSASVIWLLCRVGFGGSVGDREYIPIEITYRDNCVKLMALRDSGNTLRDPITGEQVLVISPEAACRLTGLTQEQLRIPLETLALHPISGLRLIPYRTVGSSGGMLLGLRFSDVKIGTRRQSAVVAFASEGLGRGEVYQALTGGAI